MHFAYSDAKPIAFFLAFLLTMCIINCCANAYYVNTEMPIEPASFDNIASLWNYRVRTYLANNGWVDERVTLEDLDYICQLAAQLSDYYDNVPPELTIATIAQESKFYQQDHYGGALGLMQLIPSYHRERLVQYLEEDERYSDDLFYNPRLNIMTGLDYLSQLINECDGDITYALMCYNQGPSSAKKTYINGGITSKYAKNITSLAEELEALA